MNDLRPYIPTKGIRASELPAVTGLSDTRLCQILKKQFEAGELVKVKISHRHVRWFKPGDEPTRPFDQAIVAVKTRTSFDKAATIIVPKGLKITQCPSAWKDKPLPDPDPIVNRRAGSEDFRKCGRGVF